MTADGESVGTELRASYDGEADTCYVYLQPTIGPGDVTLTVPVALDGDAPAVLLELDTAGRLVGLEVLHAATTLPLDLLRRLLDPPLAPPTERHS